MESNSISDYQEVISLVQSFYSLEANKRDQSIEVLKSLDKESTIQIVSSLLKENDHDLRCVAAEALMRLDSKRCIDLILPLLFDEENVVRWFICGLIFDYGDESATPNLIRVLIDDPDPMVRIFAADALGNSGSMLAISSLTNAYKYDSGEDREGRKISDAALDAIEKIRQRNLLCQIE